MDFEDPATPVIPCLSSGSNFVEEGEEHAGDGWVRGMQGKFRALAKFNKHRHHRKRIFHGHELPVLCVAVSPDGRKVASSSADWTVRVWNVMTGAELVRMEGREGGPEGHTRAVTLVVFVRDGEQLVSASIDRSIRIWDVATGALVNSIQVTDIYAPARTPPPGLARQDTTSTVSLHLLDAQPDVVLTLAISADGRWVASSTKKFAIRVWDLLPRRQQSLLEGHTDVVTAAAFSAPGADGGPLYLATGGADETVWLWDALQGDALLALRGHAAAVQCLAFSPDAKQLVSGSKDGSARVWDTVAGRELAVLHGDMAEVEAVAFSPDAQRVATGSHDHMVRVWEVASGEQLSIFEGHTHWVTAVAFTPQGTELVSGGRDRTLRTWQVGKGRRLAPEAHAEDVNALAFSPDGRRLISGSADKTVRVWDAATGHQVAVLEGHLDRVTSVAISCDGQLAASGSADRTVRIWSVVKFCALHTLAHHTSFVTSVAFSPTGQYVVSASADESVRVWEAYVGQAVHIFEGHTNSVMAVAFLPGSSRLASGSSDHTVRVWDLEAGTEVAALTGHERFVTSLSPSPNGKMLATGSADKTIRLWDLNSFTQLVVLEGHTRFVTSVAFSPDGRRLVSSGADFTVRLWDPLYRGQLAILEGQASAVPTVAFAPDGAHIAACVGNAIFFLGTAPETFSFPAASCRPANPAERHCSGLQDASGAVVTYSFWRRSMALACHPFFRRYVEEKWTMEALLASRLLLDTEPEWLIGGAALYLQAAMGTRNALAVQRWLTILCEAVNAFSDACGQDKMALEGAPEGSNVEFLLDWLQPQTTAMLADAVMQFPAQATEFFNSMPLVRAAKPCVKTFEFTGQKMLTFGSESFLTCSTMQKRAQECHPERSEAAEHCIIPFPHFAGISPHKPALSMRRWLQAQVRFLLTWRTEAVALEEEDEEGEGEGEGAAGGRAAAPGESSVLREVSFLRALVQTEDADLFENIAVRAMLAHKWERFGRRHYFFTLLEYALGTAALVAFSLLIPAQGDTDIATRLSEGQRLPSDVAAVVTATAIVGLFLKETWHEAKQLAEDRLDYFKDVWNWEHLTTQCLSYTSVALFLLGNPQADACIALACYTRWFGFLYFMQAFGGTGRLVRMILQIIWDVKWFMLVLLLAVLASGNAFYILIRARPECIGADISDGCDAHWLFVGSTLFATFNMVILGSYDTSSFETGPYSGLLQALFVVTMLLVTIVLLNLLIALMGDSYQRIQDRSGVELSLLRARIILEVEEFLSPKERANREWFPKYLHVLLPQGQNQPLGSMLGANQQGGFVTEIKKGVRESNAQLEQKLEEHKASIDRDLAARMDALEKKLEGRIAGLDQSLSEVLRLVQALAGVPGHAPERRVSLEPQAQARRKSEVSVDGAARRKSIFSSVPSSNT